MSDVWWAHGLRKGDEHSTFTRLTDTTHYTFRDFCRCRSRLRGSGFHAGRDDSLDGLEFLDGRSLGLWDAAAAGAAGCLDCVNGGCLHQLVTGHYTIALSTTTGTHHLSTTHSPMVCNSLPDDLRAQQDYESFRQGVKTWLFSIY